MKTLDLIVIPGQFQSKPHDSQHSTSEAFELATPSVRNMAIKHKLQLESIVGTGKGGRIMKSDILKYLHRAEDSILSKDSVARPLTEAVKSISSRHSSTVSISVTPAKL